MSNCSQDNAYLKISIAEDLTKVMNVVGVGGRSFAELVSSTDSKKSSSVPIKSEKKTSKKIPGLSPVR